MPSYQDIETRLRVIEDKVDFTMKTFAVTSRYEHPLMPGQFVNETRTLLDLYRQMKGLGLTPEEVTRPLEDTATADPVANPVASPVQENVNG